MNFDFSEEQGALRNLAREILEAEITSERLKAVEESGDFCDKELWNRLAEANLLGLAVPELQGGMGMGFFEVCLLLHEIGRKVAPVPVSSSLIAGLAIAEFGSEVQRDRWLAPLAKGDLVLATSLSDFSRVTARRDGESVRLDGTCALVSAVHLADRVLLVGRFEDSDAALFLVDPAASGVEQLRGETSRREPVFELSFEGVVVPEEEVFAGEGVDGWLAQRLMVACAATQVGVSERALEITTGFLKEREQFGAPLGALPPVQHRCADCYIALDAMRWVMWMAAWKLANGRSAQRDAWAAKFWAADAGSRIANATQHMHGGMGVDLDYPIHRYFLWSKSLELALGAATPTLLKLGRDMAQQGPRELQS
jgi:alkylation response protein AidB-like acyl-CoA dehydrogenase